MKLNLKAGEHLRIENDSGAGFTTYVEGNIIHITARTLRDAAPDTEIIREAGFYCGDRWVWSSNGGFLRIKAQ